MLIRTGAAPGPGAGKYADWRPLSATGPCFGPPPHLRGPAAHGPREARSILKPNIVSKEPRAPAFTFGGRHMKPDEKRPGPQDYNQVCGCVGVGVGVWLRQCVCVCARAHTYVYVPCIMVVSLVVGMRTHTHTQMCRCTHTHTHTHSVSHPHTSIPTQCSPASQPNSQFTHWQHTMPMRPQASWGPPPK